MACTSAMHTGHGGIDQHRRISRQAAKSFIGGRNRQMILDAVGPLPADIAHALLCTFSRDLLTPLRVNGGWTVANMQMMDGGERNSHERHCCFSGRYFQPLYMYMVPISLIWTHAAPILGNVVEPTHATTTLITSSLAHSTTMASAISRSSSAISSSNSSKSW